jgi:NAD(P)-dependent dehydrogenase (short-subunit alcohol dehydrogenase family)
MSNGLRFDGRVVLVTGAGRGLGRTYAQLLAARGASVVVNDVGSSVDGIGTSDTPADETVQVVRADGGEAVADHHSVADEDGAAAMVARAIEDYGHLDAVINNAGIQFKVPFEDLTPDELKRLLDVHVMGTALVSRAAWPHLVAAGRGRLVNTASALLFGMAGFTGYGAAKGAIYGLTRNLAHEGARHRIMVNCIAPGAATRMLTNLPGMEPPADVEAERATIAPEFAAPVAAYLAHDECRITGECLAARGGRVSRYYLAETRGFADPALSPEHVRDHLDTILDSAGADIWSDTAATLGGIER